MTDQKTLSPRAWAELGLLSLIWGGSFLSIRIALDEIPFVTSVAYRVGFAALALWIFVLWRGGSIPRAPKLWGAFLVMGLLNNVLPFTLMAWGQLYVETGLTSILNAATAVFGVLVAALIFADERLTWARGLGVALGMLGVATAIGLHNFRHFDLRSLAQLAIIAGTICYAFAGAWARLRLKDLPPEIAAAGMLTGSSVIMIPAALVIDGAPTSLPSVAAMAAVGYYALIATAFAYLLYYRVLALAGAGNLMLCTLLVAPVAILLGAWVRDETLTANAFLGFGILALGLLVLDGRLTRRLLSG
ncbi:DMT family transporter [Dinoroseobacter sp. S76]|uniref:DMT family transporter n=1 Tax=Dinoroseobacter sp. S76 TaxID=3415124 RepID=UPI003C7BBDD2